MKLLGIVHAERVANIIAIPFFLIAFVYLWKKANKSVMEWILMVFLFAGLVLDTLFTLNFLNVV
jgi:hypothetical protein